MSLITEDGTGKENAESFISVEDASIYHTLQGNAGWTVLASDTVREQCLRRATNYMTTVYRDRWEGVRYTEDQALDWPRAGVVRDSWSVDIDEVPVEVAHACAELALKSASDALQADLTQGVVKEKVGVIEVEYNQNSPQSKRYPAIDFMLRPFLNSGGGTNIGLVRC